LEEVFKELLPNQKIPLAAQKITKNYRQKTPQNNRKPCTVLHRFRIYIHRQRISICDRTKPDAGDKQKKPKTENKNQKTGLPITAAKHGNKQTLLFWPYKNINISR